MHASTTVSRSFCLVACLFLFSPPATARPIIFQENARLTAPDANFRLEDVVLDGDDLLAVALTRALSGEGEVRSICPDATDPVQQSGDVLLLHYRRQSDGTWRFQGQIASGRAIDNPPFWQLALRGGVGAFVTGFDLRILERTSTGWKVTPFAQRSTFSELIVRDGTIAVGAGQHIWFLGKNAAGNWVVTTNLQGPVGFADDEFLGPDIQFVANELTAGSANIDIFPEGEETYVFDRTNGTWQRTQILHQQFNTVVVDNKIAARLNVWTTPGDIQSFYTRPQPAAGFTDKYSLITDEWFADRRPREFRRGSGRAPFGDAVVVEGSRAYSAASLDDSRGLDAGSITVSRRATSRIFSHAATLLASDAGPFGRLGQRFSVSGQRVAAVGCTRFNAAGKRDGAIYIYDVPQPLPAATRIQDTFEDLNSAGWTPWGFTNWRVVTSGRTHVFRQTNTQGDARAIFEGFRGGNQSIQADLKVNAFAPTGTHWAGLMTRYTDSQNFYYLLLDANTLQIRKNLKGVFGSIASTPFALQAGRKYRVRLEAVGTWLRAYVNDRLMLTVRDAALRTGRTGLTMWKTNAEYDNVVVSSSPYTTLHADSFDGTDDEKVTPPWVTLPATAWSLATTSAGARVFKQSVAAGTARAVHGAPTDDQIVSADIRPTAFHASGGWGGLMVRYVDTSKYYFAFLHSSGQVSLRRWMNGQATVLGEVPFTVTAGTSYRMRLEAIGNTLRVYVNGQFMTEAVDTAIPQGRYGPATYRAAAEFDNFNASRP